MSIKQYGQRRLVLKIFWGAQTNWKIRKKHQLQPHCAYQTQPLYHQMQPLCPSNGTTVPIKHRYCAHYMQPLFPSNAPTVPSNAPTVPPAVCPALTLGQWVTAAGNERSPQCLLLPSSPPILSYGWAPDRRPIRAPVVSANQVTGNRLEHLVGGEAVQC